MAITLSMQARNDRLTALLAKIGTGASISFYTAPNPATTGAAITTQTLLAVCNLSSTVSGTVANGELTFNQIASDNARADGILAFGRLITSSGEFVMDGDCTLVSGGGLFEFGSVDTVTGALIRIDALKLIENNA